MVEKVPLLLSRIIPPKDFDVALILRDPPNCHIRLQRITKDERGFFKQVGQAAWADINLHQLEAARDPTRELESIITELLKEVVRIELGDPNAASFYPVARD